MVPLKVSDQQIQGIAQVCRKPSPTPQHTGITGIQAGRNLKTDASVSELLTELTGWLDRYQFYRHGSDSSWNSTQLKA